ncbi:MAG: hypothetical protein WBN83_06545 [Desulfoprunum sp.]|uniref:hypothetical protein n=1 Tax=Desulfoprunum sp. TaxID=2020866 RepID=UPI003C70DFB6
MAFNLKRRLYESLPVAVKRSVCLVPFPWLAGRAYRTVYQHRLWFDRADHAELRAWQERELGQVLRFAVDQVPAYQHLRARVEQQPPFEALQFFPLLDKDTVQADQSRYLPRDFQRIPHYETTTGGTSGNQLKIYVDDCSQAVETAFMHRQWARVCIASGRGSAIRRVIARRPSAAWRFPISGRGCSGSTTRSTTNCSFRRST